MAKLSLWLLTLAKDKPFEFLDHAIRCGDSLVGIHNLDQLRHFSLKPDADDAVLFRGPLDEAVDVAIDLRLKIEGMPSNSIEDVERQEHLLKEANEKIARLRCAADLLLAAELWGENAKDKLERVRHAAVVSGHHIEKGTTEEFEGKAAKERRGQLMFHWPLEFPEVVIKRGGFDAFVGNPPFKGGSHLMTLFGQNYRDYLVTSVAEGRAGRRGQADLCVYFLLRAFASVRASGTLGLVCSNTTIEGDSLCVSIGHMVATDAVLYRGRTSTQWPGDAQVKYIVPWIHKGAWRGMHIIDDKVVEGISSRLEEQAEEVTEPFLLAVNRGLAGTGAKIYGQGFLLSATEADSLIASSPHCDHIIQPYVNGAELYSLVGDRTERYVINFRDWPLAGGGNGPAASDFPECLKIVTERVKPEREAIKGEYGSARYRREVWWRFSNDAEAIYCKLRHHKTMLVRARISNTHAIKIVPVTWVCNEKTVLFAVRSFCVLQSSIHEAWVERYASTLRGFLQYTTAGCFESFPFPLKEVDTALGQAYDAQRSSVILERREGLTRIYNHFHDIK